MIVFFFCQGSRPDANKDRKMGLANSRVFVNPCTNRHHRGCRSHCINENWNERFCFLKVWLITKWYFSNFGSRDRHSNWFCLLNFFCSGHKQAHGTCDKRFCQEKLCFPDGEATQCRTTQPSTAPSVIASLDVWKPPHCRCLDLLPVVFQWCALFAEHSVKQTMHGCPWSVKIIH